MLLPQSRPMWLSKFRPARNRQGRQRPQRRPAFHSLEFLEDRTVLSTITPTIFTDGGAGSGSLRAAIIADNADTGTATDTIKLNSGTYSLTITDTAGQEIAAGTGDLDITSTTHKLIIMGHGTTGPGKTTIDQTVADRVFQLFSGTDVTFQDLVITGGLAQDDGTAGAAARSTTAEGGGILSNGGNLTLNDVVITNNTAQGGNGAPGAIPGGSGGNGQDARGGGLYTNGGSVTLINTTVSSNTASGGNGGNGADAAESQLYGGNGGTG